MLPKDAEVTANSVEADQRLLLQEPSDLGLHCLPKPFCPKKGLITVRFSVICNDITGSDIVVICEAKHHVTQILIFVNKFVIIIKNKQI